MKRTLIVPVSGVVIADAGEIATGHADNDISAVHRVEIGTRSVFVGEFKVSRKRGSVSAVIMFVRMRMSVMAFVRFCWLRFRFSRGLGFSRRFGFCGWFRFSGRFGFGGRFWLSGRLWFRFGSWFRLRFIGRFRVSYGFRLCGWLWFS